MVQSELKARVEPFKEGTFEVSVQTIFPCQWKTENNLLVVDADQGHAHHRQVAEDVSIDPPPHIRVVQDKGH